MKISARIKGKVYKTVVRPAMLYGLETVSLRKRQESELETVGAHTQRIHGHFQSSCDTRRMWQCILSITNYRTALPACDSDASLLDVLNSFYARFEAQIDVTVRNTIPPPEDQVLCLTTADVRKNLCRVNPWKAAGLDNRLPA
ncbi:hypothetical protein QTP70_003971 [Hemibagrus guttatus]|uniref:Uncharacterized protein n=1 Tax=Hemibagrus guttatus TaxID=175788 RepID=A0AAE0VCU2_9TELE|nr:hypothetical protein QTP70_003971 [Hemibagrus guttatus]